MAQEGPCEAGVVASRSADEFGFVSWTLPLPLKAEQLSRSPNNVAYRRVGIVQRKQHFGSMAHCGFSSICKIGITNPTPNSHLGSIRLGTLNNRGPKRGGTQKDPGQ